MKEASDSFVAPGSGVSSVALQSTVSASPPSDWLHIHPSSFKAQGFRIVKCTLWNTSAFICYLLQL